jgi:hypothetical protein
MMSSVSPSSAEIVDGPATAKIPSNNNVQRAGGQETQQDSNIIEKEKMTKDEVSGRHEKTLATSCMAKSKEHYLSLLAGWLAGFICIDAALITTWKSM